MSVWPDFGQDERVVPFTYLCPDCEGSGETWVNLNPRDPAAGDPVTCWLCRGDGTVTLQLIETADQANADRDDNYVPPVRHLTPVDTTPETTETPAPAWPPSKDAS